ncbi:MAG: nucleotidyltransferase family protein [Chordicoccus sp.]
MEKTDKLLLEALRSFLREEKVEWTLTISEEEWELLFQKAVKHQILPMIFDAVYVCDSFQSLSPQKVEYYRQLVLRTVMVQTRNTGEFVRLLRYLRDHQVHPLVVKGIVCRSLYPQPDDRPSGDEDVFISQNEFPTCDQLLREYGMEYADPAKNPMEEYEVPYGKPRSNLCIELHEQLFPPESPVYGEWNRFFAEAHKRAVVIRAGGAEIPSMAPTDHFFYLICHALKHFLHSGFGIRQICDITLFANAYGNDINWDQVHRHCRKIHAELFLAALLKIGQKYLTFDPVKSRCPDDLINAAVDENDMLTDILGSGVFGDSTMSRKHSSTITLNAAASGKEGKEVRSRVWKSVFPDASSLASRYPYLRKKPYLLPIAWLDRLVKYQKERQSQKQDDFAESLRIGKERVKLLNEYGIL